jgi:hypothetical protein
MPKYVLQCMFQFERQRNNIEETQNMSKSHNVFFFKRSFISKSHIFLVPYFLKWFIVLWVHQIKIYIKYLRFRNKGITQENREKYEYVILKCELDRWPNIDLIYFWQPYLLHFVSFFNNLNVYGSAKSRSKKTFCTWKAKGQCIKI